MGYSPWGHKEGDMTKDTEHACILWVMELCRGRRQLCPSGGQPSWGAARTSKTLAIALLKWKQAVRCVRASHFCLSLPLLRTDQKGHLV